MTKDHFDIHAEITNRVVAAIEKGAKDFQMPWHDPSCSSPPSNAVTRKTYRGINTLMLWIAGKGAGHPSCEWATFKQWQERGAQVRKGERGTPIVFYKTLTVAASAPGQPDERTIPFARASFVFNAAQVDGYAAPVVEPRPDMPRMGQLADVEAAILATKANISYGGTSAYFSPGEDRIQVPPADAFYGSDTRSPHEAYYSTILHELAHWSGAEHRLDRVRGKKFADRAYAFEEIIAELTAAFACGRLGISPSPREDHAKYIGDYLAILKGDTRAIFTAAAAAAAATDYILAFSTPASQALAA